MNPFDKFSVETLVPDCSDLIYVSPDAFLHFVSNSLKFVPQDIRPRIQITPEIREGWVRVWIEDNGIGIKPEHRDRIFRTFERLEPSAFPGTGMGLAVARAAMERMGGRVGFESEPGKGSRFWIELPGSKESS